MCLECSCPPVALLEVMTPACWALLYGDPGGVVASTDCRGYLTSQYGTSGYTEVS